MTNAQTIIQRALRQENIVNIGYSPTTDEQTEYLALLNSLIQQIIGFELGELVYDWPVPPSPTAPYTVPNPNDPYGDNSIPQSYPYPPVNVRVVTKLTAAQTVYMPQWPNDGSRLTVADAGSTFTTLTLDANGRLITGAATLAVDLASTPQRDFFYRADLADWRLCSDLSLTDDSPFPAKYDMMLICGLAIWLSPRNGVQPSQVTAEIYQSLVTKFRAQYKQEVPTKVFDNVGIIQSYRVDSPFQGNQSFVNG